MYIHIGSIRNKEVFMIKRVILCIALFAGFLNGLSAQLWSKGDISKEPWNVSLKNMKVGELVIEDYYSGMGGRYDAVLATSWLPAEGTPPKPVKYELYCPEENDFMAIDEFGNRGEKDWFEYENDRRYDEWAEMYAPGKCFDGKTDTAWCEGAKGDGIGEVVIAKVDVGRPVQIWSGFGKSQSIWEKNNRPKNIEIYILKGEYTGAGVSSINYRITAVAKKALTLADINGWQKLDLDEFKNYRSENAFGNPAYNFSEYDDSFIAIKILSVYKGSKYNDTLITEIANMKEEAK